MIHGVLSIGEAEFVTPQCGVFLCTIGLVIVGDFQTQFKLCEVHVELNVQAVIGVYIHSLDDVSCDHLLHFHIAGIEDLRPFHDLVVVSFDGLDPLVACFQFGGKLRQPSIGIQHLGAGVVDQL